MTGRTGGYKGTRVVVPERKTMVSDGLGPYSTDTGGCSRRTVVGDEKDRKK